MDNRKKNGNGRKNKEIFNEGEDRYMWAVKCGVCPECGASLVYESGCATCHGCGWSLCL